MASPPPAWREEAVSVGAQLERIRASLGAEATGVGRSTSTATSRPLRVLQVDATRLEDELAGLVLPAWRSALGVLLGIRGWDASRHLLRLVVHATTICLGVAPPGAAMLGLRYRNGGGGWRRRGMHLFASVLLPALWSMMCAEISRREVSQECMEAIKRLDALVKVADFINSVVFLSGGRHRSLPDRLTGMEMEYVDACYSRALCFEYLNQQLVWREFSELMLVVLPLLKQLRFAAGRPRLFGTPDASTASSWSGRTGTSGKQEEEYEGKEQRCGICGDKVNHTLYKTLPCNHVFCYYCIAAHCAEAGTGARCPMCSAVVKSIAPVRRQ